MLLSLHPENKFFSYIILCMAWVTSKSNNHALSWNIKLLGLKGFTGLICMIVLVVESHTCMIALAMIILWLKAVR